MQVRVQKHCQLIFLSQRILTLKTHSRLLVVNSFRLLRFYLLCYIQYFGISSFRLNQALLVSLTAETFDMKNEHDFVTFPLALLKGKVLLVKNLVCRWFNIENSQYFLHVVFLLQLEQLVTGTLDLNNRDGNGLVKHDSKL